METDLYNEPSTPESPVDRQREEAVRKIFMLFKEFGSANYVSNQVSLMEHSLQAAQLALEYFKKDDRTVDSELVIGSLLHDFGKIVIMYNAKQGKEVPERGDGKMESSKNHELLGAEFLKKLGFSERVQEICRGHVKAKRYLCAKDQAYYEQLHPASKAKLKYQGGPMTEEEVASFEKDPLFEDIMQMRTFDEQALRPGRQVLGLEDYTEMIKQSMWKDLLHPMDQNSAKSIKSGVPIFAQDDMPSMRSLHEGGAISKIEEEKSQGPALRPKAYYNREKKPEHNPKKSKSFNTVCALEHDSKFRRKIDDGKRAMKKLFFVAFICFIFMGLEAAGGYIANSLAILADAAHMFSDVAGFMISFFSIYISQGKTTTNYTMGYHRAEILGAYVSIFLIWGLLIALNWEATIRIIYRD